MEKKLSWKRLIEELFSFISKRGRIVGLIFVILIVVLLSALLCGLMLIPLTPNYPTRSENPQQVAPNPQANSTVPSQPQPVPNHPTTETISNVGSLKTIGIGAYWDENLTKRVNRIDWGLLEPGGKKSFLIYFQNEGNSAVTLSESTSNWNPSVASNYLTLRWDYSGQIIEAEKNLQVTLTLSVNASITGISNFGFDIIVVGTG